MIKYQKKGGKNKEVSGNGDKDRWNGGDKRSKGREGEHVGDRHCCKNTQEKFRQGDEPKKETPICVTLRPKRARYSSRKVSMKPWGGDNCDSGRGYLANCSKDCSNEGEEDRWRGEEGQKGSWGGSGLDIDWHKPIWGIT